LFMAQDCGPYCAVRASAEILAVVVLYPVESAKKWEFKCLKFI